jgi:hypothetical protein
MRKSEIYVQGVYPTITDNNPYLVLFMILIIFKWKL